MATLLLVEDEVRLCEMYRQELEAEGHTVLIAHNGRDGLEKAIEEQPDAVIMDISLPEKMDGLESMSRILARDKNVPIIINTAYSHYKENFLTWAADEYVVKSGNTGPLKKAIERALNRSEGKHENADEQGGR
jgi:DNA-binding response OmpR family regulator